MPYTHPKTLQGVILDWAGTTVDYGCFAPVAVFLDVFKARGVEITLAEARAPMGLFKRDHLRAITQMPEVARRWTTVHGRPPAEHDVDALYADFGPRQLEVILRYSTLIPDVDRAVKALRERGLKIGTTTGYTRAMMAVLLPEARRQGYVPDVVVCPDDVPAGRPAPWMAFQNAQRLGIYPMSALVKIGDTSVDVDEGLNAGMWTIALAKTGNALGLHPAEAEALPPDVLRERLHAIGAAFTDGGAHYVVDGLADVPPVLDAINDRLAAGERPV